MDEDTPIRDMSEEEKSAMSRRLLDVLWECMGSRVPICLIGLTYDGNMANPENMRVVMPGTIKKWLEMPAIRESLKELFCNTIDRFALHPEDRGPVTREGPSGF